MDRLFDILNSRSVFGKGHKQPIRESSMAAIGPFLFYFLFSYLLSLTTVEGVPLFNCTTCRYGVIVSNIWKYVYAGFMGVHCILTLNHCRCVCIKVLLTGIDATFGMYEKLIISGSQKYICMYRLSQDHLELFFNAVRQNGESIWGYNHQLLFADKLSVSECHCCFI